MWTLVGQQQIKKGKKKATWRKRMKKVAKGWGGGRKVDRD
jgi:hypothetical protein